MRGFTLLESMVYISLLSFLITVSFYISNSCTQILIKASALADAESLGLYYLESTERQLDFGMPLQILSATSSRISNLSVVHEQIYSHTLTTTSFKIDSLFFSVSYVSRS